jgi:hypothetical protein
MLLLIFSFIYISFFFNSFCIVFLYSKLIEYILKEIIFIPIQNLYLYIVIQFLLCFDSEQLKLLLLMLLIAIMKLIQTEEENYLKDKYQFDRVYYSG